MCCGSLYLLKLFILLLFLSNGCCNKVSHANILISLSTSCFETEIQFSRSSGIQNFETMAEIVNVCVCVSGWYLWFCCCCCYCYCNFGIELPFHSLARFVMTLTTHQIKFPSISLSIWIQYFSQWQGSFNQYFTGTWAQSWGYHSFQSNLLNWFLMLLRNRWSGPEQFHLKLNASYHNNNNNSSWLEMNEWEGERKK